MLFFVRCFLAMALGGLGIYSFVDLLRKARKKRVAFEDVFLLVLSVSLFYIAFFPITVKPNIDLESVKSNAAALLDNEHSSYNFDTGEIKGYLFIANNEDLEEPYESSIYNIWKTLELENGTTCYISKRVYTKDESFFYGFYPDGDNGKLCLKNAEKSVYIYYWDNSNSGSLLIDLSFLAQGKIDLSDIVDNMVLEEDDW